MQRALGECIKVIESGGEQTEITLNGAKGSCLHFSVMNPFGIHHHTCCLDKISREKRELSEFEFLMDWFVTRSLGLTMYKSIGLCIQRALRKNLRWLEQLSQHLKNGTKYLQLTNNSINTNNTAASDMMADSAFS
jgi:hypothetical protein